MTFEQLMDYYDNNTDKICKTFSNVLWETFGRIYGSKRELGYLNKNPKVYMLHKGRKIGDNSHGLLFNGLHLVSYCVKEEDIFTKLKLQFIDNCLHEGYVGYISEPRLEFDSTDGYYCNVGITDIILPDLELTEYEIYNKLSYDTSINYTEKMFRLLKYYHLKFNFQHKEDIELENTFKKMFESMTFRFGFKKCN